MGRLNSLICNSICLAPDVDTNFRNGAVKDIFLFFKTNFEKYQISMSHSFPGISITTKGAVNQNVILCLCQTKNICVAFLLADA